MSDTPHLKGSPRRMRQQGPGVAERTLALILPLVITATLLFFGGFLVPEKTTWLLTHAGVSFIALGKLIVLGKIVIPDNPLSPWELALLITYMDTLVGVLCVYNIDFFFRLPWVGQRLRRVRLQARRALLANPWLRRQAYLGIIMFVMFPLTGTGAVGASFLGKFMGVHRFYHLLAICFGGAVGGFSMAGLVALLGEDGAEQLVNSPIIMASLIIVLLVAMVVLGRAFFKNTKSLPKKKNGSRFF